MTSLVWTLPDGMSTARWAVPEGGGGGSQPGLRTVQVSFSWSDVDTRDPAIGLLLATVAADEQLIGATLYCSGALTGTDAADASGFASLPGAIVSSSTITHVSNAEPVNLFTELANGAGLTGDIVGAFANSDDSSVPVDLAGGEITVTLVILGGS